MRLRACLECLVAFASMFRIECLVAFASMFRIECLVAFASMFRIVAFAERACLRLSVSAFASRFLD